MQSRVNESSKLLYFVNSLTCVHTCRHAHVDMYDGNITFTLMDEHWSIRTLLQYVYCFLAVWCLLGSVLSHCKTGSMMVSKGGTEGKVSSS